MAAPRRKWTLALVMAVALVAGACGDDAPSTSATTTSPPTTSAAPVIGTWLLRDISPPPAVMPSRELSLDMRGDGTFVADAGCNAQLGKWRRTAAAVEFYDTGTTVKACERPDVLAFFVSGRPSADGTELRVEDKTSTAATYVRR